jgi:hypothetical protein
MNHWKLLVILVALSYTGVIAVASAQDQPTYRRYETDRFACESSRSFSRFRFPWPFRRFVHPA